MDERRKNTTAIDIFMIIATLIIIGLPVYGYFKLKPDRIFYPEKSNTEEKEDTIPEEVQEEENDEEPIIITGYSEELVEIDGQWAYIAVPTPLDPNNIPRLIIYNHGSVTRVEENLDPSFEEELQQYAETMTPYNYIFAVSNARGYELDSDEAIMDNYNLYNYINDRYEIQERIYMTAYSKGGIATFNFTVLYPELVEKIALIAPKMKLFEWDYQRAQGLKSVPIKIWHGTDDVNISLEENIEFITQMKEWGVEIELVTLKNTDHWNIEMEHLDDVVEFFNQSEISAE